MAMAAIANKTLDAEAVAGSINPWREADETPADREVIRAKVRRFNAGLRGTRQKGK